VRLSEQVLPDARRSFITTPVTPASADLQRKRPTVFGAGLLSGVDLSPTLSRGLLHGTVNPMLCPASGSGTHSQALRPVADLIATVDQHQWFSGVSNAVASLQ
jgi:hypothetical protein